MHNPESVLHKDTHKLLGDSNIKTDPLILVRRPDLIIINKKKPQKNYVKKSKRNKKRRLMTATNNSNSYICSNRNTTRTRKQKWKEKHPNGYFKRQTIYVAYKKTGKCIRKGSLKRETEFQLIETQNNAMRTIYMKAKIDDNKYILCREKDEAVNHRESNSSELVQKECNGRHEWVSKGIHWVLCKKT